MEKDKLDVQPRREGGEHLPVPHWMKRFKRAVSLLFSSFAVCAAVLFVLFLYLRSQALPAASVSLTSQIVDLNGNLIDSYHTGENRQFVPLSEISPWVIKATLAIEDHRFFEHHGFDWKGMIRASGVNLLHMSKVQGASTLTQQLARNLYLSHEKTWTRKLKEAYYTIQLEMRYSKEEILEKYLNQIYYGHATYGIQTAAKLYFNKDAKDLTLAESSLLAGVPKGPKYYSPYMDKQNAKSRQKAVLQAMADNGFITREQADEAYKQPLTFMPLVGKQKSEAPYFRDYIRYLALEKLGLDEKMYKDGGLKIYTTLDMRAQKIAEEVIQKYLKDYKEMQAALVAIDPRTGYIKAMVGGRDYEQNQFNRALSNSRQPGSAFKPFVYLAALETNGMTAVTRFKSEPTVFTYDNGKKTYTPSNYGNHYPHDYIDMRQAISQSDNIYAVHSIMKVGAEKVVSLARRLGIGSPLQAVPSLALGTSPVSPFEMASAFGVIANGGVRVEPTAIVRIEDAAGNVLYEAKPQQQRVIDPGYTYVLTSLMESVFDPGGTASRVADMLKRPVAAKTGTTNSDAWMVGFTPELSTAVWVGYDRDRTISSVEQRLSAPIFAEFTEKTLEPVPPKIFPIPDDVVSVYIDTATGKLATEQCPNSRLETFVQGTEPAEYCSEHGAKPLKAQKDRTEQVQNRSWWQDLKRWWNE